MPSLVGGDSIYTRGIFIFYKLEMYLFHYFCNCFLTKAIAAQIEINSSLGIIIRQELVLLYLTSKTGKFFYSVFIKSRLQEDRLYNLPF